MDWDEPRSTAKPKAKDLTVLGVADLEAYITDLTAEIERARQEIAKRGSHKNAAEALFRKS